MSLFEDKIRERRPADARDKPLLTFTLSELIRAILSIDNDEDAKAFYAGYVTWISDRPPVYDNHIDRNRTPGEVARANIGWCFGEGMPTDRIAMWRRVCGAEHPVLHITETERPTPEEAYQAGIEIGRNSRKGA